MLAALLLAVPLLMADLKTAEAALESDDFDRAARIGANAVKANGRDPAAHVILARVRMGQNNAAAALDELDAALKIDPNGIDALYYLNKLTSVLAQRELTRLYRIAPDSGRVHQLMAESLHGQENTPGEEREYLAALKRMPKSAPVLSALGDLKRYQAKFEEAIGYYSRAEAIDKRSYEALYGLGACHIFLEDYRGAIRYLERALEVDPRSAAAQLALGDALLRDRQNERAVKVLARLTENEPSAKQGWALFGKALRQLGRKREADAAFARYRELARAGTEDTPQ